MKLIQRNLKSILDGVISLISLIILAIPFLIIALVIKLDSKGPIFFRQERVGKGGKLFKLWKFRTMVEGAVNQGLGYNVAQNDP